MQTTEELTLELLGQLKKSKQVHDVFADRFRRQYQIGGKLMGEWKSHFHISMSPDLNPATCKELDSKVLELHQEATFLKAESEARLTALKDTNQEKYRMRFTQLVMEYKLKGEKLPAKDTLATLAEQDISATKDAITHATIEVAFWKEILADLYNSRKIINNATINLSVEAKALANEKTLDRLNNVNGGYNG